MKVVVALQDPDIIVITETFPKNSKPTNIHCNEYKLHSYNCFTGNVTDASRGVFIFVKDSIPAESCHRLENLPFKESTWCELRINQTDRLLIGGIYKSPKQRHRKSGETLNCFLKSV